MITIKPPKAVRWLKKISTVALILLTFLSFYSIYLAAAEPAGGYLPSDGFNRGFVERIQGMPLSYTGPVFFDARDAGRVTGDAFFVGTFYALILLAIRLKKLLMLRVVLFLFAFVSLASSPGSLIIDIVMIVLSFRKSTKEYFAAK